jgi:hypothetical protein
VRRELGDRLQVLRGRTEDVGRSAVEQRLDHLADPAEVVLVAVPGVGVAS